MWTFSVFSTGILLLCVFYSVKCGTVFKTIIKPGNGKLLYTKYD